MKEPVFKLKKYRKWKKRTDSLEDLLPLRSVDVMFNLTKELIGKTSLEGDSLPLNRIIGTMWRYLDYLCDSLERIDEYYRGTFDEEDDHPVGLKDYINEMQPFRIVTDILPKDNSSPVKSIDSKVAMDK